LAVWFFLCRAANATYCVPYIKIHSKWHHALIKIKDCRHFFILIKLKKWLGFYFYECIALFAMYLDKNYIANNAAALHRKNHTREAIVPNG
jgi:hypothetical protein